MTTLSPKERRHDRIRKEILDAARAIIVEQGVGALSMRALAEKVDYSASALYKYFDSKEALIAALRLEALEMSASSQQSHVRPGMSIPEMLVALGQGYIDFSAAHPAEYLLIMSPAEDVPDSFADAVADPGFKGLNDLITAGITSGELRLPPGYRPLHLALLSWFLAHGISMLRLTLMRKAQPEFDQIASAVLSMVAALLTPQ
jgi:AcrR family transcriptional regulator